MAVVTQGEAGAGPTRTAESAAEPTVRLARELTLADATLLGVGALVGGGIFVLPGIAAGLAGPAVFLALALNALVLVPTLLVYAELSSVRHDAGGGYVWVRQALHEPWGFLGGWMNWFAHAVACAVYALASAAYLLWFLGAYGPLDPELAKGPLVNAMAVAVTAAFVALNVAGAKQAIRAEAAVTLVVLLALGIFVGSGLAAIVARPEGLGQLGLGDPALLFPQGLVGMFLAMGLTVIAFQGFEIVAQAGEEVRRPERNVPRAILLCVAIVSPLLVLVAFVALAATVPDAGMTSWQWLAQRQELALVEAAAQFVPFGVGAIVVLVGAMLSNVTALNSTIYSSSRVSFAMGRDRSLPGFFSRVHPRTQTPAASILFSGGIVMGMAALLPIQQVAAAAGVMFLLLMMLVNASYIAMRRSLAPRSDRFRAPWFPALPLVGIAAQIVLAVALFHFSPTAWLAAAGWVVLGALVHHAYARRHVEPAAIRTALAYEKRALGEERYGILLPVANPATVPPMAAVASELARDRNGEVVLLHVLTVPFNTLPSAALDRADEARPILAQAAAAFPPDVPVHSIVKIAHDAAAAIVETAEEERSDLILLGWRGRPSLREHVFGSTLDPVVRDAPADVALLRPGQAAVAGSTPRVVVAVRGRSRHLRLGAEVAKVLSRSRRQPLVAVTVVTSEAQVEPEARLASAIADAGIGPWEATVETIRNPDPQAALLSAAGAGDTLVLGASEAPAWKTTLVGTVPERVAAESPASVLLVRRHSPAARFFGRFNAWLERVGGYLQPDGDAGKPRGPPPGDP